VNLDEIQDLALRAKARGMNPIERLDAMGLILTDERHIKLVREACELLADRIEQESLQNLMGRERASFLADVKNGIVRYIRRNFVENSVG
jgi:hypothetical protein